MFNKNEDVKLNSEQLTAISNKLDSVATKLSKDENNDESWWLIRKKVGKIEDLIEIRIAVVGNVVNN